MWDFGSFERCVLTCDHGDLYHALALLMQALTLGFYINSGARLLGLCGIGVIGGRSIGFQLQGFGNFGKFGDLKVELSSGFGRDVIGYGCKCKDR